MGENLHTYQLTIKRTFQTQKFEGVTVEVSETLECEDSEVDSVYKKLSARLEKYVGHEARKYGTSKEKVVR